MSERTHTRFVDQVAPRVRASQCSTRQASATETASESTHCRRGPGPERHLSEVSALLPEPLRDSPRTAHPYEPASDTHRIVANWFRDQVSAIGPFEVLGYAAFRTRSSA